MGIFKALTNNEPLKATDFPGLDTEKRGEGGIKIVLASHWKKSVLEKSAVSIPKQY